MSRFKANTTYVYETVDGVVYAREFNKLDRMEIGRTPERVEKDHLNLELWHEIIEKSRTCPALQQELDRVKMFYLLMQQQESTSIPHHPV